MTARTPRQWVEHAFKSVCAGIALERSTDPEELSTGERSRLENYGLECFRLGMEFERESRGSQRPARPAPAPDDEEDLDDW